MRYLIITNIQAPFITDYFDFENQYNYEIGMIVFDLKEMKYIDGAGIWYEIEEDHW